MILAAGRGERMRPLTDVTPKPLLEVKGKALIVWHIEKLAKSGFKDIVINIAHLGYKIPQALGDGSHWGVNLHYSDEQSSGGLETLGGIVNALPLLGEEPFLVVNGDIFCDYDFTPTFDLKAKMAHLVLVPNPEHNTKGDFALEGSEVLNVGENMLTFSGIAYYNPKLFFAQEAKKAPLAPLLREAVEKSLVSGELFTKVWHDIGTPQRLKEINDAL